MKHVVIIEKIQKIQFDVRESKILITNLTI